jgi:pantoate--beta-alanine ligase
MHIFKEIAPLRTHLNTLHSSSSGVGLVPTMGALHEGHLSLIRAAKKENATTVCSIYVNPTQFSNKEDLEKYPRMLDHDLQLLESESCDIVFCPESQEMYGSSAPLAIAFQNLDNVLEGKFRPGHFSGVAQVVAKLFNIIQPDRAYFGQKDYQQVMIINRLIEALKFNVKLISMPIVREADGLAMSSRNQRLSSGERKRATVLYACLLQTRDGIIKGSTLNVLQDQAESLCLERGVTLEYLAVADKKEFILLDRVTDLTQAVILIAAQVGPVRLIDNLVVQP